MFQQEGHIWLRSPFLVKLIMRFQQRIPWMPYSCLYVVEHQSMQIAGGLFTFRILEAHSEIIWAGGGKFSNSGPSESGLQL